MKDQKIIRLLLDLVIFTIPLGVIARITILSNFAFYPHDIFAGLLLLLLIYKIIFKKNKIIQSKTLYAFLAFACIGFFSLLINPFDMNGKTFLVSLSYLIRFMAYFSLFFIFQFVDKAYRDNFPKKMVLSGAIFMFLGFFQYIFYNDLRNLTYLGVWDEHLFRLFSTFFDPNFAGAFLVLLLILLLGYMLAAYKKGGKKHVIYSSLMVLSFLAILLTYSRSAIIMLLVGVVVFLVLKKKYRVLIISAFTIVVLYFLFANTQIVGLNPFRMASIDSRIGSAREAFQIFSDNPVIGVGFNAYRVALMDYGYRGEPETLRSNADATTDNSYLFVLATTGIAGFTAFTILWINIMSNIYKKVKTDKSNMACVAFASVMALSVNTLFISSFFFIPIFTWIVILAGITVSRK